MNFDLVEGENRLRTACWESEFGGITKGIYPHTCLGVIYDTRDMDTQTDLTYELAENKFRRSTYTEVEDWVASLNLGDQGPKVELQVLWPKVLEWAIRARKEALAPEYSDDDFM